VVGEQEAPRPSTTASDAYVRRKLRGDLDNILLTALRKEPARRYTGVGAFSEDLLRYLEDRPVRARPATLGYKARKFVSRNKVATAAGALAAVALLAGTAVSIWNAQRAHSEARRGTRHFEDVRHLANSFLFEFHDAIADLPGATDARRLVVSRALQYLDKLSHDPAGGPALQLELAEAYSKIGDVQGKPYTANLGDSAGAIASYTKAAEIASSLVERETGSAATEARRVLSTAFASLAAVEARTRQVEKATQHNLQALAFAERLLADDPAHADEWRRLLVACYTGLGDAIQAGNQGPDDPALYRSALEQYRRAMLPAEELVAAHPDSTGDLRLLAKSCARVAGVVAELAAHTGEAAYFDEALALHQRNIELCRTLAERNPQNTQFRRNVADALIAAAHAQVLCGRDLESARAECAEGVATQEALAAADPSNVEAQQDLSFAYYVSGRVEQARGDLRSAAGRYRECLRVLEPLIRTRPDNVETAADLARVRQRLAEVAR
jgi:tetratricopeptide (TPR) repeat protein